jgi:hypothetical protein
MPKIPSEAREYRETLAINKLIAENPEMKEAWQNKQLALDKHLPLGDEDEEEGALQTASAV